MSADRMGRYDDGLIAKSSWWLVRSFQAIGVLAFFCGVYNLLRLLDARADWGSIVLEVIFFFAISYFALVQLKMKEIRMDKTNGTVEYIEKAAITKKVSRKYMVSQVKRVEYQKQGYRVQPWIYIEFRDGTKIDCETDIDYIPNSNEFAGANVEHKDRLSNRLKIS